MKRSLLPPSLAAGCLAVLMMGGVEANPSPGSKGVRPKLVVLIFFDQLRGDFLSRWDPLFEEDGLRRLQRRGTWFTNCHYPYALTVTAPGHASVATGRTPREHGIISNEWYDRQSQASVNCVSFDGAAGERFGLVPEPFSSGKNSDRKKAKGYGPDRLLTPTIADALKLATSGRGKVVSLSFKDRGAILPGGRQPDVCCWSDGSTGGFVTSRYYRERLPAWVAAFNEERVVDRWFGTLWERLRPDVDYDRWAGDDHGEGEGTGSLQGRAFPHPLGFAPLTLQSYYGALYNSPYGNELLLELALRAIEAEKLGQDDDPDLLCLSFSSNDAVGHTWGPDSHEVLDTTLRTDRIVARLLQTLDRLVGDNQYVVALTADHGICPLPEAARLVGINAARVTLGRVDAELERHLTAKFGAPDEKQHWIESRSWPWYYLNLQLIERLGLSSAEVEQVVAEFFAQQPGIEAAYTRKQLASQALDPHGMAVKHSTNSERAGEVYVLHKPYHLVMGPVGTSHGSPYDYDTHVPLLLYGCGVRTGVRDERITPLAVAGLLAQSLGISPPPQAEELNLADLFVGSDR